MKSRTQQQKSLTQAYKRQPKKTGVYCIRNIATQKCFVGASRDIDARLNRHRFALKSNSEQLCGELQADWNRLGSEYFEFVVLDIIDPPAESGYDPADDLLLLEQLWLEQLDPFVPNGYNALRQP